MRGGGDPRPRRALGTQALAVALLVASIAAISRAQDLPREEAERAQQGSATARRTADAAKSDPMPVAPSETVTYAQVLENPDDPRLNYLYAHTLIRRGEPRGAAATLERILLTHPELPRVRLLYATVLYRLDNLAEAKREFRTVQRYDMPESVRRSVARYLAEIERRQRRTRFSLASTFGTQYDSNRNAGPRSDELRFLGQRFPLEDVSKEEDDVSYLGVVGLRAERDLESQAGHRLLGEVSYYVQEQTELDELDLQAITGRGGALLRTPWLDLQALAYGSTMTLSSETFLRESGVQLSARRPISARADWVGGAWLEYEDFDDVPDSTDLSDRTGFAWGFDAGAEWRLAGGGRFEARVFGVDKHADEDFWAYSGVGSRVRYSWPLRSGQFLVASASLEWDRYDDPDPLVDSRRRRDLRWRQQLLYGVPLRVLLGRADLAGPLRDILISTVVEYFRSSSSLTNYSYDNWRASLLFTKRIDF